jgi:hypothetical protein
VALLEHGLLHGLVSITDKSKCDQAAVAVTLGTEPLEPQRMPGHQGLQGGAAVIGDFDAGEPQLAAVAEQQGAAVTHRGDVRGADGRELAVFLGCRSAHTERGNGGHSGRPEKEKNMTRSAFHDGGRLPEFATMPCKHSRHCDHRGRDQCQRAAHRQIAECSCGLPPPRAC